MSSAPVPIQRPWATWLPRIRFWVALLLLWAVLQFVLGPWLLPRGLDAPFALTGAPLGLFGALLFATLYTALVLLAGVLCGAANLRTPLLAASTALGAWLMSAGQRGGTMDDWLALQLPDPNAAPSGAPYLLLLGEMLLLTIAVLAAVPLLARLAGPRATASGDTPAQLAWDTALRNTPRGWQATLIAAAVAGLAIWVLIAPLMEWTRRGQVFFATAVGLIAGVYAARYVTEVRHPVWYLPVPLLLGLVGLLVAGFSPTLMVPDNIDHFNTVPAWPLARPLPLEWIAGGVFGAVFLLSEAGESEGASDAR